MSAQPVAIGHRAAPGHVQPGPGHRRVREAAALVAT